MHIGLLSPYYIDERLDVPSGRADQSQNALITGPLEVVKP